MIRSELHLPVNTGNSVSVFLLDCDSAAVGDAEIISF